MDTAERHYLQLADHVLTVSEADRVYFSQVVDARKISVIPTGVDVDYFQPVPGGEISNSLVFTGSMDWLPNEDAMIYFVQEIMPLIQEECPDVTLEIVGRKPGARLAALVGRHTGVRLTGWVEDVRPNLARGAVCIVPLRIGGGTRLKIFEAMAMSKAVVSTSIGAEGLPVQPDENIFLADTPAEFARSVVSLLHSISERKRLGEAARKLVAESYSWRNVGKTFAGVLQDVVARCSRSATTRANSAD